MFNVSLVHCRFFLLHVCAVISTHTIHTYKCLSLVLLCQCPVWILFNCYVVAVCHPCHTLHHIITLSSLSLLYITHHSACFPCYVYVHMHHANIYSVLHMLIVCLDHATHALSPPCAIVHLLLQNKKMASWGKHFIRSLGSCGSRFIHVHIHVHVHVCVHSCACDPLSYGHLGLKPKSPWR